MRVTQSIPSVFVRITSFICVCVATLVLCGLLPTMAFAQSDAVVSAAVLKVAGGSLHQGDRVVLQSDTASGGYYTVQSGPAGISYPVKVSASDVVVQSSTTHKVWHGVATARVALYAAPSSQASVVSYLEPGEAFTCAEFDASQTWYVAKRNGQEVYFTWNSTMKTYWGSSGDAVVYGSLAPSDVALYKAPLADTRFAAGTLPAGTPIACKPFDSSFYFAKDQSGHLVFIERSKVIINTAHGSDSLDGYVKDAGLTLYAAPSMQANKLQTISAGVQVFYVKLNDEWAMATMEVSGKTRYVYFPVAQVSSARGGASRLVITKVAHASGYASPYSYTVDAHYAKGSLFEVLAEENGCYLIFDGTRKVWLYSPEVRVMDGPISVREETTSYNIAFNTAVDQQYAKGTNIVYGDGSWPKATRAQVAYYMNPQNFGRNTTGYFQFLRLDRSAGINPEDLNKQLGNSGILSGQGKAFSEAAQTFGVNEAYLIAHAKLETGNGTSNLAAHAYYNPTTDQTSRTKEPGFVQVYNMYGIGAYDGNAFDGGTRFAYKQGWTTPEKAIIGGAEFVAKSYFMPRAVTLDGQNTLYKMLFHPQAHAQDPSKLYHQYATASDWAASQTANISKYVADYSAGTYLFDVPRYR